MLVLRRRLVDLHSRRIAPAEVRVEGGAIRSITHLGERASVDPGFLLPGFVDAHVHVESSMLAPREFARAAARHGTVATVSDPHEIANVLGEPGIEFMLGEGARACLPIAFGVPSCVPATPFETAGATLDSQAVARLLADPRLTYLSEMMNYPGVLAGDPEVLAKIAAARRVGKPVDGHAPGVMGEDARRYAAAGITTVHECFTLAEALDQIAAGMKVLMREGSAARNLDDLLPLFATHPAWLMFSTDDSHPEDLLRGHVDRLVARAVDRGCDLFDVLRAACVHPVEHYRLPVGLLREGDRADFIVVDDLRSFRVRETFVAGTPVARDGCSLVGFAPPASRPNRIRDARIAPASLAVAAPAVDRATARVRAILVEDGQLVTGSTEVALAVRDGVVEPDPAKDCILLAVCNRYLDRPPAVAFVRGLGIREGAIAASVSHDSHHVVAAGADRASLARAIDAVFAARGGLAVLHRGGLDVLPLPIAGLMSDRPIEEVGPASERLTALARSLGSPLRSPLMMLSFLSLLVIPSLKLGDRGLFDCRSQRFVPVVLPA